MLRLVTLCTSMALFVCTSLNVIVVMVVVEGVVFVYGSLVIGVIF